MPILDEKVDLTGKVKSDPHKQHLGLLERVRASFSGIGSKKVHVDEMSTRRESAPAVMNHPVESETVATTLVLMSGEALKSSEKAGNICCDLLRHGNVISHEQKRDFIIGLMRSNVACLDFSGVPLVREKTRERTREAWREWEGRWNHFFAEILKYHPSIFEIKPPIGITLSPEVTAHLAIHHKLAQVIEYDKSAKAGVSHSSTEREQQRTLAAEVVDVLRERWAFENEAEVWQGLLRQAAVKPVTQRTLDAHEQYIEGVDEVLEHYVFEEEKRQEDVEGSSISSSSSPEMDM